ncbi:zeta toxin family protein [Bacillus rhizoplanae]|uniref:zeta toxin family protein n=1 Tax=Bacillus rhizoplanae TaxID=2880966 RepID=UPI003D24493B
MHTHQPMLFVFAGNNGSGKSTLRDLIIDKIGIDINIDPDAMARKLDSEKPESKWKSAGIEALNSFKRYIKEGKDFSNEATLTSKAAIRQMKEAKEKGYEVTMFYIALSDVNQNIERVAMRVKNGGHDIPTEVIESRSTTSFEYLYEYAHIIDNLVLIDNSKGNGEFILEINNGIITYDISPLPRWASTVVEKFKKG